MLESFCLLTKLLLLRLSAHCALCVPQPWGPSCQIASSRTWRSHELPAARKPWCAQRVQEKALPALLPHPGLHALLHVNFLRGAAFSLLIVFRHSDVLAICARGFVVFCFRARLVSSISLRALLVISSGVGLGLGFLGLTV